MPVPFDIVDLTSAEIEVALLQAKVEKHKRLENDRRKHLALKHYTQLTKPWLANELYEHARLRATILIRAEKNDPAAIFEPMDFQEDAIKALSFYFSNSEGFEKLDTKLYNSNQDLPFNLNKGIWLWSNPGQGKTLMMQMFAINKRQCYQVMQCPKIVSGFVQFGEQHISGYSKEIIVTPQPANFYQGKQGICYNDLGTERTSASHYTNSINVMETIMLDSYEQRVPFSQRHVTTNLTFDQVKEMYGVRVTDRIKQCFNIIEINGKSLRK